LVVRVYSWPLLISFVASNPWRIFPGSLPPSGRPRHPRPDPDAIDSVERHNSRSDKDRPDTAEGLATLSLHLHIFANVGTATATGTTPNPAPLPDGPNAHRVARHRRVVEGPAGGDRSGESNNRLLSYRQLKAALRREDSVLQSGGFETDRPGFGSGCGVGRAYLKSTK
jgi:hypothetical protein